MDHKQHIRALLAEAQVYRDQGLLQEALALYHDAAGHISDSKNLKEPEKVLRSISEKIDSLKADMEKLAQLQSKTTISPQVQDLIKHKFAFSDDAHEKILEGAKALAKFGQYEAALTEFDKLLPCDPLRITAAKNIIRCHFALTSIEDAVAKYHGWLSDNRFSSEEMHQLNVFFQGLLDNRNMNVALARPPDGGSTQCGQPEFRDEELMDVSSIGITLETGPEKGRMIELDVCFQNGNEINLLISSRNKDLIENLKVGFRLNDVHLFSPFAIFTGTGVVSAKTQIKSGPKKGDYSLDIKVISA